MNRFPVLQELYSPFISAIRVGDLSAYDKALDRHERRLVDLSIWLVLEKARELCLRGLFRKVYDRSLFVVFERRLSGFIHQMGGIGEGDKDSNYDVSLFTANIRDRCSNRRG